MTSSTTLSKNDLAILGALFDPETSLSANSHIKEAKPSESAATSRNTIDQRTIAAEKAAIQPLNRPSPTLDQINSTIQQLTSLIEQSPTYASAYANRAQATRLLPDALQSGDLVSSILSDLNTAVSLLPSSVAGTGTLNSDYDHLIATTHAHRAYILLHGATNTPFFELLRSLNLLQLGLSPAPQLTQAALEELASQDFAVAGRHGDEQARSMAVKTNPYAKLCGSIVREALREEIRGYYEGCGVEVGTA